MVCVPCEIELSLGEIFFIEINVLLCLCLREYSRLKNMKKWHVYASPVKKTILLQSKQFIVSENKIKCRSIQNGKPRLELKLFYIIQADASQCKCP